MFRTQILDVLTSLDAAFAKKQEAEVKRLWPDKTKNKGILDSLKLAGQKISFKPLEDPKLQGDTATVLCTLHTELPGPETRTL